MNGIILRLSESFPWEYVSSAFCRLAADMHRENVPLGPYGETVRDLMLAGF